MSRGIYFELSNVNRISDNSFTLDIDVKYQDLLLELEEFSSFKIDKDLCAKKLIRLYYYYKRTPKNDVSKIINSVMKQGKLMEYAKELIKKVEKILIYTSHEKIDSFMSFKQKFLNIDNNDGNMIFKIDGIHVKNESLVKQLIPLLNL